MSKPREFWINEDLNMIVHSEQEAGEAYHRARQVSGIGAFGKFIHVIEYSEYEKLRELLKEALNEKVIVLNWKTDAVTVEFEPEWKAKTKELLGKK